MRGHGYYITTLLQRSARHCTNAHVKYTLEDIHTDFAVKFARRSFFRHCSCNRCISATEISRVEMIASWPWITIESVRYNEQRLLSRSPSSAVYTHMFLWEWPLSQSPWDSTPMTRWSCLMQLHAIRVTFNDHQLFNAISLGSWRDSDQYRPPTTSQGREKRFRLQLAQIYVDFGGTWRDILSQNTCSRKHAFPLSSRIYVWIITL